MLDSCDMIARLYLGCWATVGFFVSPLSVLVCDTGVHDFDLTSKSERKNDAQCCDISVHSGVIAQS